MAKIWEYYRGYVRARHYTDLITRSCFRSIRIEGMEHIPAEGAVMLAPNHCATLMDPMLQLLLRPHKDPIAFGARSDIFKKPRVAKILRWLRIVPLARERNGLAEVAKNFEVFDEIIDCLDHDVPFCMYAEGTHHPERGMLPVKKGIFRIAKMASEQLGKPIYIVPIGTRPEDPHEQMFMTPRTNVHDPSRTNVHDPHEQKFIENNTRVNNTSMNNNIAREKTSFKKPTVEEIAAYIQERKSPIDAEAFYAYYESIGWKVGNKPMKSWKMAIVTWEKRRQAERKENSKTDRTYGSNKEEGFDFFDF